MAIENFKCPLNNEQILPITKFIEKDDDESCGPCTIAPLSSYYMGALEEAGEGKLAQELKKAYDTGDILTIAEKLDSIKSEVGEALKEELKELDCFAQVFKES